MAKNRLSELLELSVPERIQLAEDLWDSVASNPDAVPLTETQALELDRRLEDHSRDPGSAVAWEDVRRRLYEKLG